MIARMNFGILMIAVLASSGANGETRYVATDGKAEAGFTSLGTAARDIASALDVARDGDLIVVAPGTYHVKKPISINRAVTLLSAGGAARTKLVGAEGRPPEWCFDIHSSKAIVDGFSITQFRGGVRFSHGEGTSAVIRNCVIAKNSGHGIFFNHGGNAKNCTVVFNGRAGLYAYDMGGGGDSPSNLILFGNQQPFVRQSANIQLKNCVTKDPKFISKSDFRLTAYSPCIDQGRNESWMIEALDASGAARIHNKTVDVGAFEFVPSEKSLTQEKKKNNGWLRLLPLVRANRDLRNAVWSWSRKEVVFSSGKVQAKVSIPIKVQGSYEFRLNANMVRAKEAVSIFLPVTQSSSVALVIKGDNGNTEAETSTLRLTGIKENIQPRGSVTLKTGTSYLLSGRIVKDGKQVDVEIFLNNELVFQWSGKQSQIREYPLIRPSSVQLETAYYTTAKLSDFKLKVLHGKISVLSAKQPVMQKSNGTLNIPEKLSYDSTKSALEKYKAELIEIERVANLRKQNARKRLDQTLKQIKKYESEKEGKKYRGMLGSYFNHQSRIPFIMLSVPNGENVRSEHARRCFNDAKYDASKRLYKFEARGNVIIPSDGIYRLVVSRAASIKLNGIEFAVGAKVAGESPYADVKLEKGVYEVFFNVGNNGGQLPSAMIRIEDRKSKKNLPIFVYESELKKFRNDLSLGSRLIETSKWTKEESLIE